MQRFVYLLVVMLCVACSDDEGSLSRTAVARRVVVVYMMAENSLSSAASSDLSEIRAGATAIPAGSSMVVFFDNSNSSQTPQIIAFDSSGTETVQYTYDSDVISTDSATMLSALQRIIDTNPAEEYALVLWSHGSGWVPANRDDTTSSYSIGIDNGANTSSNTGTEMDITTLRAVLEQVGILWRYIFYDACFMQCIEVAYELRQVTEWSIGSPAEIPSDGADYTLLMPYFFSDDTFAADLTEQYYNIYKNSSGMLLAAIRSSALENLASATAAALATCDTFPTDDIQQYCTYARATGWKPEYYDLASSIHHWCDDSEYAVWVAAMDAAIPYRYSSNTWMTEYAPTFTARLIDADHYAGTSIYVPMSGREIYNAAWRTYAWYTAAGYLLDN